MNLLLLYRLLLKVEVDHALNQSMMYRQEIAGLFQGHPYLQGVIEGQS